MKDFNMWNILTSQEIIDAISEAKSNPEEPYSINFTNKTIEGFPDEFWAFKDLRKLAITNCEIKTDLDKIGDFENLTDLSLFHIDFDILPFGLFKLKKLKSLTVDYCGLLKIPDDINELSSIKTLSFVDNKIIEIPENLFELGQLKELYIYENGIERISESIIKLNLLEDLQLDHNLLKEFPIVLTKLPNLKRLDLSNNNISIIPPEIKRLEKLQFFEFGYNPINSLPPEFSSLKNSLKNLTLDHVPLLDMPELKTMGIAKVFSHLETLCGTGKHSIDWEIPDPIVTPFQQYLNYFRDFLFQATGEKIKFDVLVTGDGLKLVTEATETTPISRINELLALFISQNTHFEQGQHFTKEQIFKMQMMIHEYQGEIHQLKHKVFSQAQKLKYLGDKILSDQEVGKKLTIKAPLFDDSTPRLIEIAASNNDDVSLNFHPSDEQLTLSNQCSFDDIND